MNRLINVDALIEAHYDYCNTHHGEKDNFYTWSLMLMKNAPTIDAVEVVRCKDCAHLYRDADSGDACEFTNMAQNPDDFCSYGVRKAE